MRTADDLVARAEADGRGVALIPLSEPNRDISFETPAAARVRLKQIKPKPNAVERADTLPASAGSSPRRPTWRLSGSPTASISAAARSSWRRSAG